MLNEGTYVGKLVSYRSTMSKSNIPGIVMEFSLTAVAEGDKWREIQPTTRRMNLWLSEKSTEFSMNRLHRMGFNGKFGDGMDFGADIKLEGIAVNLTHSRGNDGKDYENLDLAEFSDGGQNMESMTLEASLKLEAKWRSMFPSKPALGGKPSLKIASSKETEDDTTPF